MTIVITNCTSRKTSKGNLGPATTDLRTGTLKAVACEWKKKLTATNPEHPASAVYCGRGFREAEVASKYSDAELYVISAGLGVIHSETKIPRYNLTVSAGTTASIMDKVTPPYTPQSWWNEVTKKNPYGITLNNLLALHPNELILLSLSRTYIDLISHELEALPTTHRKNLRIFSKNAKLSLPHTLQDNWMPYDDRLQMLGKGYSGTQSDFAQRALKHFVYNLLPTLPDGTTLEHSQSVSRHFQQVAPVENVERKKLDDEAIAQLMRKHSKEGALTFTALLKIFRHSLGIACEQSRFKQLYQNVQNEYNR